MMLRITVLVLVIDLRCAVGWRVGVEREPAKRIAVSIISSSLSKMEVTQACVPSGVMATIAGMLPAGKVENTLLRGMSMIETLGALDYRNWRHKRAGRRA
ncbi:MAG TPA: hypothetical protein VFF58_00340 [Candidatus Nitrosotalea sp.]|nr:hypothetical protein [Candidatus Nitrosotalea sp.]